MARLSVLKVKHSQITGCWLPVGYQNYEQFMMEIFWYFLLKIDKFYIISKLVRNIWEMLWWKFILSIQPKVQDFSDKDKTNGETGKINKESMNKFCNFIAQTKKRKI